MQHSRAPSLALSLAALSSACSSDYTLGTLPVRDVQEVPSSAAGEALPPAPDAAEPSPDDLAQGTATTSGWPSFSVNNGGVPSAANLGDLDADGISDWGYISHPAIEIRYGGARPTSESPSDARLDFSHRPGYPISLEAAGDLDGDGYDDVLIQMGQNAGDLPVEARVLYGGPRLSGTLPLTASTVGLNRPDYVPPPGSSYSRSNGQGRALGDIDGDGFADFLLIGPQPDDAAVAVAYVFYGRPERLVDGSSWAVADAKLTYSSAPAQLPDGVMRDPTLLVEPAGDLDGDGRAEVLLETQASPWDRIVQVHIWRGDAEQLSGQVELSSVAPAVPNLVVTPVQRGPVDLDGDGLSDLLVTTVQANVTLVYYGREGLLDAPFSLPDASWAGWALPLDWNGDGFQDLLIWNTLGSPAAIVLSPAERWLGGIDVEEGSPGWLALPPIAPDEPERVSRQFWIAGDIDGDGRDELLAQSWYRTYESPDTYGEGWPELHVGFSTAAPTASSPLH